MTAYVFLLEDFIYKNTIIKSKSIGILEEVIDENIKVKFIKDNIQLTIKNAKTKTFNIRETGDEYENKVCDRCFRFLPTSFFSNNRIKKHSITKRPSCKDCRKIKDGFAISTLDRQYWETKKPINYELFDCPICRKVTIAGLSKIVLDHNHNNGEVRGYLCESCNTGIGRFDDDPKIILNAIQWLKKS